MTVGLLVGSGVNDGRGVSVSVAVEVEVGRGVDVLVEKVSGSGDDGAVSNELAWIAR